MLYLVIQPGVIFHADLASSQELVTHMLQSLPPGRLAVLVSLELARLHVVHTADLRKLLLLVPRGAVLPLLLLLGLDGDPPLRLPVGPDMRQVIC